MSPVHKRWSQLKYNTLKSKQWVIHIINTQVHTTPDKCDFVNKNPEQFINFSIQFIDFPGYLIRAYNPIQHVRHFCESQEADQRNRNWNICGCSRSNDFHFSRQAIQNENILPLLSTVGSELHVFINILPNWNKPSVHCHFPSQLNKCKQSEAVQK